MIQNIGKDKVCYGEPVFFYDFREPDLNRRVVEGKFIAGSSSMELTPRQMLTQLINSEHDLRLFCDDHGIHLGEKENDLTWKLIWSQFTWS